MLPTCALNPLAVCDSLPVAELAHAIQPSTLAETKIAELTQQVVLLISERDKLKERVQSLCMELDLLKRRIFAAKAERIDTAQLEMEFAALRQELEALVHDSPSEKREAEAPAPIVPEKPKKKSSPPGRRDLLLSSLPHESVVLRDAELEATGLVPMNFEVSTRLGYRRGGAICIVVSRAKYAVAEELGSIVTTELPKELVARPLCASSMMAKIIVDKFADGLPFHRQSERFQREGLELDRSLMCRMAEDVGMTLGCIVLAARDHAMQHAFCLSTDATGVAIQPTPIKDGTRQPCRRGHFFVTLADADHVFFSYEPKHTSKAVCELFAGYTGYIQADASSVYDLLFQTSKLRVDDNGDDIVAPTEVGCMAHARRKLFEAAISTKDLRAREGLMRIRMFFEKEAEWGKLPPGQRGELRKRILKPWLSDFFEWAKTIYDSIKDVRGRLATAFGYLVRHQESLCRFLDDGRLKIDNNASERALRRIAVGRKNWLFCGSDDHAVAAANLMSLIASCKLHGIEPTSYLEAVIRLVPVWPAERRLELAPMNWLVTRDTLVQAELDAPFGHMTVPPPKQ